jgi:LMBR1 domain-containing protein 1
MAIISFLGFFFFVIFGGVGLSALPIELIRSFMNRPTVVKKIKKKKKKNHKILC